MPNLCRSRTRCAPPPNPREYAATQFIARIFQGKNRTDELATAADVILAVGSVSLVAARQASQTIPIVALDLESDPIASGAAQSLNRPGGNVTGIFLDAPEIAGKWIQLINEIVPRIKTVALLYDLHLDQTQLKSGESTANRIGIETLRFGIDKPGEFRGASSALLKPRLTLCSCVRRQFLLAA